MPRLDYLQDGELSPDALARLEHAETAGSPDPRVLRVLFKSPLGLAWYRYWLSLCNEGELPRDLKELCRVKIAFDHNCGYCGTVRSTAAIEAGLTEERSRRWGISRTRRCCPRGRSWRYASPITSSMISPRPTMTNSMPSFASTSPNPRSLSLGFGALRTWARQLCAHVEHHQLGRCVPVESTHRRKCQPKGGHQDGSHLSIGLSFSRVAAVFFAAVAVASLPVADAAAERYTLRVGSGHPAGATVYVTVLRDYLVPELRRRVAEETGHELRIIEVTAARSPPWRKRWRRYRSGYWISARTARASSPRSCSCTTSSISFPLVRRTRNWPFGWRAKCTTRTRGWRSTWRRTTGRRSSRSMAGTTTTWGRAFPGRPWTTCGA